jgi:hypothetical protein
MSATFPASIEPKSLSLRLKRAASIVALRRASAGVKPALTSSSTSS